MTRAVQSCRVVGLVHAESPDDELVTYEWATEIRFDGSVQVGADTVTLVIEDGGELWERTITRTRNLRSDLTRCLQAVEELRARPAHAEVTPTVEQPAEEPATPTYDHRDIAAG
jgi:hypothetical protein